jgi:hypothetical protein
MEVMLQEVLYCPNLGYTLISLARCDAAGYSVVLKDKLCSIKDRKGHVIGQIPQQCCLYRVYEENSALMAKIGSVKIFMMDELHRKMGHIFHAAIKKLITDKIILGLELDKLSQPSFCPTCAKAKPSRKPFLKNELSTCLKHLETRSIQMFGVLKHPKVTMESCTMSALQRII